MAVQTTLTTCLKDLSTKLNNEQTKTLLSKWISDPEIEWTIPNAPKKVKQNLDALDTEKIVCFCCPDYP